VHSEVQALKLNMFPMSTFAKRPQMAPPYLSSTMPYKRWTPADGAPWDEHGVGGKVVAPTRYYQSGVADADAQFDHQETTLSHLFRFPHPALAGRTYGAALVDALAARGFAPGANGTLRVLEIGAGLGWVADAMIDALATRDVQVEYTIVELSPTLAAAQKERLAGRNVRWVEGDVLAVDPGGPFDWILANEMIGDLPALKLSRPEVGLSLDGSGNVDPDKLAALGRPGELAKELGIFLDDATEPFYLMSGAFELVTRVARWLAPGGVAVITEFGETGIWPKLSTHLDHPELSTHFGQLAQAARGTGLAPDIVFIIDLLDLDRTQQGLATTRSHFRALRAMLAEAGVTLEKIGYTPALLEAALGGKVPVAEIGELRWDKIEDRLMGLVPHEFKALIATKPATDN
jgi:SAM-dependent methyltransferase